MNERGQIFYQTVVKLEAKIANWRSNLAVIARVDFKVWGRNEVVYSAPTILFSTSWGVKRSVYSLAIVKESSLGESSDITMALGYIYGDSLLKMIVRELISNLPRCYEGFKRTNEDNSRMKDIDKNVKHWLLPLNEATHSAASQTVHAGCNRYWKISIFCLNERCTASGTAWKRLFSYNQWHHLQNEPWGLIWFLHIWDLLRLKHLRLVFNRYQKPARDQTARADGRG